MNDETWKLVQALQARTKLVGDGRDALKRRYPHAPAEMIDAAAFHLFVDGAGAGFGWLAALERFLLKPQEGIDSGKTFHLLYHLYNWHQFEVLLPSTPVDVAGVHCPNGFTQLRRNKLRVTEVAAWAA